MRTMTKRARNIGSFRILSQTRDGRRFHIACRCGAEFSQPRSSISVECPTCGETAMMTDLALDFRIGRKVA